MLYEIKAQQIYAVLNKGTTLYSFSSSNFSIISV